MPLNLDLDHYTVENISEKGLYWNSEPLTVKLLLRFAGERRIPLYVEEVVPVKENGQSWSGETKTSFRKVIHHDLRGAHLAPWAERGARLCLENSSWFTDIDFPYPPEEYTPLVPAQLVIFSDDLRTFGVVDTPPDKSTKSERDHQKRSMLCVALAAATKAFVGAEKGGKYTHSDGRPKAVVVARHICESEAAIYPGTGESGIGEDGIRFAIGTGLSLISGDYSKSRGLRTDSAAIKKALAILIELLHPPVDGQQIGHHAMADRLKRELEAAGFRGSIDTNDIAEAIRGGKSLLRNSG